MKLQTFLEIKALLGEGFSVPEVCDKMREKDVRIGYNRLYDIKSGKFDENSLPESKHNEYFKKGNGERLVLLRDRINKRIKEQTDTLIDDTLRRTQVIEQLADAEIIGRLSSDIVALVPLKELVAAADSANKRNLLERGKPTDIFKHMDNLTPELIIELAQYEEDTGTEAEVGQLSEGSDSLQGPK